MNIDDYQLMPMVSMDIGRVHCVDGVDDIENVDKYENGVGHIDCAHDT